MTPTIIPDRFFARRALQAAVVLFAFVPVLAGLAGILLGPDMITADAVSTAMDSHYRYLSGLLLGIGIGFWTTVPAIETKTVRFRLLTVIVLVGGVGRLYSLIMIGAPSRMMLFGLAMELIVTPLFAAWQGIVASKISPR